MKRIESQIVICGGGLGGTLAAYSAAQEGKRVILLEETDWIGGQLTSQAVPPDEHEWIESQGCTRSYREYRNSVRDYYRSLPGYSEEIKKHEHFCPGDSEVSFLSHPPKVALRLLTEMLEPYVSGGLITVFHRAVMCRCVVQDDEIQSVVYRIDGEDVEIVGSYYLDATDTGELICHSGAEYRVGAESRAETGEEDAPAEADPADMQPITYTACIENRRTGDYTIPKPPLYETFRQHMMPYDKYPLYSMFGPDSSTGKAKQFGMFVGERGENGEELFPLFIYRRIVKADYFTDGSQPYDVTLINWPQNDFFLGNIIDCQDAAQNRDLAQQFTLGFVYWLQTEAPRPDGGKGYPWFRLAPEYLGTENGLSMAPYVRESRRIKAKFTVTEECVCDEEKCSFPDSVGVGRYPIDLHITTGSHSFFYKPTYRFTIPLGAMIPVRMKNLLPACKNIGTTHLTNGCYRLHHIEWNIGEVAGLLASFALDMGIRPVDVWGNGAYFEKFAALLEQHGIQRYWEQDPEKNVRSSKPKRVHN